LADVCVFNAAGARVPHALSVVASPAPQEPRTMAVPYFPVRVEHAQAPLELSVTIARGADGQVLSLKSEGSSAATTHASTQAIALYLLDLRNLPHVERGVVGARFVFRDAPDNLILPLSVESSEDLISWQPLAVDGGLLHLEHAGQHIDRDRVTWAPAHAQFLRVRPASSGAFPAQLTTVEVEAAPATAPAQLDQVAVIADKPNPKAPGVYRFDLGGPVPVEELEVQLPEDNSVVAGELFSAERADGPYQRVAQARFYRIVSEGKPLMGPRLQLFRQHARFYELRLDRSRVGITDGLPTLVTYHAPEQLLFLQRGQAPFTVAYGRHALHLARFEPDELLGLVPATQGGKPEPTLGRLSARRVLGGEQLLQPPPPKPPYKTYALWAVLIAGVGVLGMLAYRLARATP
jgi:hypothetical protein